MKKVYRKPLMAMENFTLTERIAACENKDFSTTGSCATDITPEKIYDSWVAMGLFTATCMIPVEEGEQIPGTELCYHQANGLGVFGS